MPKRLFSTITNYTILQALFTINDSMLIFLQMVLFIPFNFATLLLQYFEAYTGFKNESLLQGYMFISTLVV